MKAVSDIEIIDALLKSDYFEGGVSVTYPDISVNVKGSISKGMIDFISELTDSEYEFIDGNKRLCIGRITPIE